MKLQLINRSDGPERAFSVRHHRYPHFLKLWHYHPELELVVIRHGTGMRFAGDGIEKFRPGEIVLIGANLPHMWLNDAAYFAGDDRLYAEAICVHFREDFAGRDLLEVAGGETLKALFQRARRGILFEPLDFDLVAAIREIQAEPRDFPRTLRLLSVLYRLAESDRFRYLTSEGYLGWEADESADKAHEYVFKNFTRPLTLPEVARVAGMNPSAFSRYFKRIHRKTFSRYLIELRVGYACKLLLDGRNNVSAACYESGFNNISNFNKQFKKVMGMNPSTYIQLRS